METPPIVPASPVVTPSSLELGRDLSHYTLLSEVGRGGMGIVYRARDRVLDRDVALKVLPPDLVADRGRRARFVREAKAAAALDHPHIAAVHEIGEAAGRSFIAMEFIQGEELRDVLARGPLPLGKVLDLAIEVAEGLECAHARGVVHRDLKPANVMVTTGGHAKIIDFGLAKLVEPLDDDQATMTRAAETSMPGQVMGTISYMSPEQAKGEWLDHRTDIFSFGLVLYEMLTGQRAFQGASAPDTLHAVVHDQPPALRPSVAGDQTAAVQAILTACLRKDVADRYQRTSDLVAALRSVARDIQVSQAAPFSVGRTIRHLARQAKRPRIAAAIGLVLLTLGGLTAWAVYRHTKVAWAREVAMPEIARLVEKDEHIGAVALAEQAEQYIRGDPALDALIARASQTLTVKTTPDGADVYFRPYSNPLVAERHLGRSPIQGVRLPAGPFWLRVEKGGYDSVQSFYVPAPSIFPLPENLTLAKKGVNPPGMVWIELPWFALQVYGLPVTEIEKFPPFLIDDHEATNREFERFVAAGGYEKAEYWEHPFVRDGRTLGFREAMTALVDKTGRPGPATWEAGGFPDGQEDFPVSGVSWYEAAAFARFAGKSLPTVYHWSAATNALGASGYVMPFGNFAGKGPRRVRSGPVGPEGTWDMAGNVKEWCWNPSSGDRRFILGGGFGEPTYMYFDADARPPFERAATHGFRCVRYLPPGSGPGPELTGPLEITSPPKPVAVSDEAYAGYVRQYAYERTSLHDIVETKDESSPYWTRERIVFDAAYNRERVIAYLYVPKNVAPPHQTVVFFPGGGALYEKGPADLEVGVIDFVIKSGRAVMYPIYEMTNERGAGDKAVPIPVTKTKAYTEHVVRWMQDLGRSVDFLATRGDIDMSKLAYYGISWGAQVGPIAMALEPRLRLGVFLDGGVWLVEAFPEASETTFAPRVTVPMLMVNGKLDAFFPFELSQKALLTLLGTPVKDKKHVTFECGHGTIGVFRNQVIGEILAWLDQHFGKPARVVQGQ